MLDLSGPVPYELTGPALRALAEGRTTTDPLADPAVREAVRAAVAAEPAVLGAYLGPGRADGTLALVLDPEGAPEDAARAVMRPSRGRRDAARPSGARTGSGPAPGGHEPAGRGAVRQAVRPYAKR